MKSSQVMLVTKKVTKGANVLSIDLGSLPNGMYVVHLSGSSISVVEKIIVIH